MNTAELTGPQPKQALLTMFSGAVLNGKLGWRKGAVFGVQSCLDVAIFPWLCSKH